MSTSEPSTPSLPNDTPPAEKSNVSGERVQGGGILASEISQSEMLSEPARVLQDLPLNADGAPYPTYQHALPHPNHKHSGYDKEHMERNHPIAAPTITGTQTPKRTTRRSTKNAKRKQVSSPIVDHVRARSRDRPLGPTQGGLPASQEPLQIEDPQKVSRVFEIFPAFEGHFTDGTSASAWWQDHRKKAPYIHPVEDPTIPIVMNDYPKWIQMLYEMIMNQEDVRDNLKSDTYRKFVRRAKSSQETEAACHEIMTEVFRLCHEGFQLKDPFLDVAKKGGWSRDTPDDFDMIGDQDLEMFMRLIKICYALKHEKTICAEVLCGGGSDRAVQQFINAPIEWRRRKSGNRVNNNGKKDKEMKRAMVHLSRDAGVSLDIQDAKNKRSPKQKEPPVNSVVIEANALGIEIPDIYRGLLVAEVLQPPGAQALGNQAEDGGVFYSQSHASIPTTPLPTISSVAAPSVRQNRKRRRQENQSTTNTPDSRGLPQAADANEQVARPKKRARNTPEHSKLAEKRDVTSASDSHGNATHLDLSVQVIDAPDLSTTEKEIFKQINRPFPGLGGVPGDGHLSHPFLCEPHAPISGMWNYDQQPPFGSPFIDPTSQHAYQDGWKEDTYPAARLASISTDSHHDWNLLGVQEQPYESLGLNDFTINSVSPEDENIDPQLMKWGLRGLFSA